MWQPKRTFTLQPFHCQECPRKGRFIPSQLHSVTSFAVQAFAMLCASAADNIAVVKAASLVPSVKKDRLQQNCIQIVYLNRTGRP